MYRPDGEAIRGKVRFKREISPQAILDVWRAEASTYVASKTRVAYDFSAEKHSEKSEDGKREVHLMRVPGREEWIGRIIDKSTARPRIQDTRFADASDGFWMEYSVPVGSLEWYRDLLVPVRAVFTAMESLDGSVEVLQIPEYAADDLDVAQLIDEIDDDSRRLPLIVFSEPGRNVPVQFDAQYVALVTSGFAHIRTISETGTYRLSDTLGKANSAFLGYGRLYEPGFSRSSNRYMSTSIHSGKLVGSDAIELIVRMVSRTTSGWSIPRGVPTNPPIPQILRVAPAPATSIVHNVVTPKRLVSAAPTIPPPSIETKPISRTELPVSINARVPGSGNLEDPKSVPAETVAHTSVIALPAIDSNNPKISNEPGWVIDEQSARAEKTRNAQEFDTRLERLSEKFSSKLESLVTKVESLRDELARATQRIEELQISAASSTRYVLPKDMVAVKRSRIDDFVSLAEFVVDTGRQIREDELAAETVGDQDSAEDDESDNIEQGHVEEPSSSTSHSTETWRTLDYPSVLDKRTLKEFCDENFPNILIHARAFRAVATVQHTDPQRVFAALAILDQTYASMRLGTEGKSMDDVVRDLADIRTTIKARKISNHMSDEYSVIYKGSRERITHEICSKSSPRDQSRILRVYFFWDSDDKKVVICHLPSHLPIMNEST